MLRPLRHILLAIVLTNSTAMAAAEQADPYCGLYCLYGAIKAQGGDIPFRNLLQPQYIGSSRGSSPGELVAAAKAHGLHAALMENMTTLTLRALQSPAILLVRGTESSQFPDHYVLCLGVQDGQAKILDAREDVKMVPLASLLNIWDGLGVVVSREPIHMAVIPWSALPMLAIWISISLPVVWGIAHGLRTPTSPRGLRAQVKTSMLQAFGLAVVALLLGSGYALSQPSPLLMRSDSITEHFTSVGSDEAERLIRTGAAIIDARFPAQYVQGHINNARNIPIFLPASERHKVMADVPQDAMILVYCNGAGCRYDARVAAALRQDGFTNLSLLYGGWDAYHNRRHNDITTTHSTSSKKDPH